MFDSTLRVMKMDEGARVAHDEGAGTFDRSFRVAVVEFFAVALLLYHKLAR